MGVNVYNIITHLIIFLSDLPTLYQLPGIHFNQFFVLLDLLVHEWLLGREEGEREREEGGRGGGGGREEEER